MLDSIYQLGLKQEEHDDIVSLLTPTLAKYVIGIIFHNKAGGSITYNRSELFDFEKSNESWYLFRRSSGRPDRGVFLTCDVSRKEIDKIRKNFLKSHSTDNLEIQEFIRKKIMWFPHGQLVTNRSLFDTLNNNRKQELCDILVEFERNSEKISTDVIQQIIKIEPQITLLTIMISSDDDNVEGDLKFVGQIKDYVNFFKEGILSKKYKCSEELYCSVCNKKKFIETFNERPLPFYFADNPLFFPDGQYSQSKKGFPICDDCYIIIQKGIKFIYNALNYSISELGSNKRELNFWLIPHLNDQEVIVYFKDELEKNKSLYLNTLKDLCSTLKIISRRDQHDRKNVEAFLRFSALFFTFDRYYIRIINYIQGIYPSQLEKLFDIKAKVDNQYPFPALSLKFKEPFLVGFPLLIFFYKEKDKKTNKKKAIQYKWQIQVSSVLARIFTGQPVMLEEIIHKINLKVRKDLLKSFDLESLSHTIFLGLMLLEYLISLNDGQNHEKMSEPQTPITKEIEHVQKFIESHSNVLLDGNSRAIFAVGICVGILLQVQELRYDKTAPFWNRLNRLDMNFQRVIELLPEVKTKLAMYNERKHDTIINYLAVNEVSRIDDTLFQSLSKDSINLIFSIGLSYGYMLTRGFIEG